MPIFFKAPPDPLARPPGDETRASPEPLLLAESAASKRLEAIIGGYCSREIAGRSVLIAGHRGAGKTTVIKAVIQKLRRLAELQSKAIPLYVQIHGPDLLGSENVVGPVSTETPATPAPSSPSPTADSPGSSADSVMSKVKVQDQEEVTQALTSLRVLTIALHRAFVTDMGWAFERSVSPQHAQGEGERGRGPGFHDLQEVAAQLRLDFDDLVETDGLRWMWKRAGILRRGILRRNTDPDVVAANYFSQQGLLEIVAATCVSDSFIRGVAKVDDFDTNKTEAEFKQSREIEKIQERKELANVIAGILGGALVGMPVALGGAHTTSNGVVAGALFVFSSAFITLFLNYTSVRSRSTKRSKERNIRWDRSVASLDLMLPLAITRVLDAGRAPIFVIDELDKVNEIESKLERLINRLKHIVADRALFCFLVDRPYFEQIQNISRTASQRKEHTFFSERLYVIATPAQWRAYLQSVMNVDDPSADTLQLLALTYVLLARSKMHAIDLRREIEALTRDANTGRLELPDLLGPPLYRNMVYMQAVVEYVLQDDRLASRLQRDPNFVQYAYDALYYLLRQWEQDLPPAVSRHAIRDYLELRASKETLSSPAQHAQNSGAAQGDGAARENPGVNPPPELRLSDVDFDLLYAVIEQMAHMLSEPDLFKGSVSQRVAQKQLPREWTDVVEILPGQPLLQRAGAEWHWLQDINANPLQIPVIASATDGPAAMQPKTAVPGQVEFTESKIAFVEAVEDAIRFYTDERLNLDKLASELRLLSITPSYNSFSVAAANYRAGAGPGPMERTYPSLTSDVPQIEEYEKNLRNALKSIKRTLFLAELLAWEKSGVNASPGTRTRDEMVKLIAADLDFKQLNAAQLDALLAEFKDDFENDRQAIRAAFERITLDETALNFAWVQQLQKELQTLGKPYYAPASAPAGVAAGSAAAAVPVRPDLTELYFAGRGFALIMHSRDKRPLRRLSLAELTARAVLELAPFHGDPDTIRLLDYADAFVTAKTHTTPSAALFGLALLATLGFGKQIAAQVPFFAGPLAATIGEEVTADVIEAAKSGRRSGERVLLVLGGAVEQRVPVGSQFLVQQPKGEGSYAAAWTISKTHAVLPIHISDLPSLGMVNSGIGYDIVPSMGFTLEIHDEGLTSVGPVFSLIPQLLLAGADAATPTSLDDVIATLRKNVPATAGAQ